MDTIAFNKSSVKLMRYIFLPNLDQNVCFLCVNMFARASSKRLNVCELDLSNSVLADGVPFSTLNVSLHSNSYSSKGRNRRNEKKSQGEKKRI